MLGDVHPTAVLLIALLAVFLFGGHLVEIKEVMGRVAEEIMKRHQADRAQRLSQKDAFTRRLEQISLVILFLVWVACTWILFAR